jgi:hypothetical protein
MSTERYYLCLTAEERQLVLEALNARAIPDVVADALGEPNILGPTLINRLSNLRDKNNPNTAGVYEFKGLYCELCGTTTPHYHKYKSQDKYTCDSCGSSF